MISKILFPKDAGAAISLVRNIGTGSVKGGTFYAVSTTVGASVTVAVGNTVIVTAVIDSGAGDTTFSCTDSRSNTYNIDINQNHATNGIIRTIICSSKITTALTTGDTITVNWGPNSHNAAAMSANEFSGLASSALDKTAGTSGSGTNPSSGNTATTTQADELLIGSIGAEGPPTDTFTSGTNYTPLTRAGTDSGSANSNVTINPEYRIVSATGAYLADGTITSANWVAAIATYKAALPAISGTVYTDEGTTNIGSGKTVRLLINGSSVGTAATDASGNYSITPASINSGDALLAYIDGDATYKGTTVTVASGADITNFNIYSGHVITRHDNGGSLSNANMSTAKGAYSDTDILYSVLGGNLTVSGTGTELYVPAAGNYAPGGDVATPAMENLGTFNGGAGTIDINGALTIGGGSFTAPAGDLTIGGDFIVNGTGGFVHNGGTVILDGTTSPSVNIGTATLNNLTIFKSGNYDITVTGTLDIDGDLTLTGLRNIISGTLDVEGSLVSTDTSVSGSAVILLDGTTVQTINAGGQAGEFPSITVNKSGAGSVSAASSGTLGINALTISGNSFTAPAGDLTIGGDFIVNGTGGFVHNGGTVILDGTTSPSVNIGTATLNNLTISKSGNYVVTVTGTLDIDGDLTLTGLSSINGGTLDVEGSLVSTDTSVSGSSVILLDGTTVQTINAGGQAGEFPSITVNKSGAGSVSAASSGTLGINALTISGNSFTATAGDLTIGGDFIVNGTGGFVHNGGTVILDGTTSPSVNIGAATLNNLTIFKSGNYDITVTGTLDINGNLTLTNLSSINGGSLAVEGNLTSTDTAVGGTGSILLNGSGAQTIDTTGGGDLPNGTLTINKPSGAATLAAALTLNGAGQDLTITAGTLDLAGYNLTLTGAGDALTVANGATLQLQGGETVTATTKTLQAGSTVIYNGSGAYGSLPLGNSYHHLAFNGAGSWTLASPLDVNGDLTIAAGTVNANGNNINVTGDWSNSGTFTHGSATVTLDGTNQQISGSTTFNHFTKSVAAADTLTFAANSTTTVNGIATLNGASGQLLSLRSSSPGTRWNLILSATATNAISYVDVQDSDASGSDASKKPINPTNSTNSGNCVDWFLYRPDAMIKLFSEADGNYLTDDTYETTATAQVKSQGVVSGSTSAYAIKFQNDAGGNDNFVITGTGNGSGFTVQYLDETVTDRTASVTGAGYTISSLASGASKVWTLNVMPSGSVSGGTSYNVFVTATSGNDSSKKDQVKATTSSTSANLTLLKSADLANADPGQDITYTVTATNASGLTAASNIVITDPIPTNTGFKVGGASFSQGTSTLTSAISYSNDGGSTWTYTPASGGCSAPSNYDYCVTHVRWTMSGNMPSGTNFSIGLVVKVK